MGRNQIEILLPFIAFITHHKGFEAFDRDTHEKLLKTIQGSNSSNLVIDKTKDLFCCCYHAIKQNTVLMNLITVFRNMKRMNFSTNSIATISSNQFPIINFRFDIII